jgi:zinc protease
MTPTNIPLQRQIASAMMCIVLLLGTALAGAAPAGKGLPVYEHKLANGMRILVQTDRRAPVVVSMVWYRAGGVDEHNGVTGVAHVLEHMMFKGTQQVPAGQFSRMISAAGGRENAFTSRDYTAYFQTIDKRRLDLAIRLEADRMTNLVLSPEEFSKEIRVVMEERRWRTDDRPHAILFEQLNAVAYKAHPYRNPTVGWMNDLENMKVEDARAFYEQWYAPNNAILVIVGDVDAGEVFALSEKHFGPLKARNLPERKPQEEPAQRGMQRIVVKAPAEQPFVLMAYKAPMLRHPETEWEPYALEMLASVLDGSEAARLNRALVRGERIVSSADASYDAIARGPGMFYLSATPSPGVSTENVEQALRREVAKIVSDGVSPDELKRVKAQAIAGQVYQRDSMFGQARQIGALETTGFSYRLIDRFLEKLQAVTPEQVQAVAKKYLVDDTLTIAYLDPQPLDGKRPAAPPPGVRHGE